ncbi:helix-turn-helix transcriptional regulator [Pseudoflavitalea sp. X16]|uniref:helix-turn-helix domain-containing protein n=1 Tax=Paraflavitalea devenefica TaxID=2716334 RepID=UPI0014203EC2|nr:AraC family transcriptional regulator [Paraflavitalea devenefica]NII29151.1 helix-turn-helix transcriptional regulator [Paraflavitalea devenefica]
MIRLKDKDMVKLAKAEALIIRSLDKHYTIVEIARMVQMPEKRLKWAFKHTYGMGIYTYLKTQRLLRAKVLMLERKRVHEIIQEIGYSSQSNFSKAFTKTFKERPSEWRKSQLAKTA